MNTQLAAARSAQSDAQAKAKLIRDAIAQGRLDEISDIANNDLVRQLSLQRVALRGQLALAARTLLPQHPRMKELRAQLSDLDAQLRLTALTAARGLENDARIAEARYESIRATLDQQKQTVGDSGVNEVRLRALDRNAKLIGDQLEASMAKYQEAVARETSSSTPGDARVISRAIAPQLPSFPRKIPTLIFATLAAFVLSAAAAIAAELLSDELTRAERLPTVVPEGPATVPEISELRTKEPWNEDIAEPAGALIAPMATSSQAAPEANQVRSTLTASDAFSTLVSQAVIISRASGHGACTLIVGSSDAAPAGAAAVDIGRALAAEGRTILVELRSGLLAGSGLTAAESRTQGLGELVRGEKSFAEVIHRDADSRLHFIVAGVPSAQAGDSLDVAVEALGETYDHLVVLAAPIASDRLAVELAGEADLVGIVPSGHVFPAQLADLRSEFIRNGAGEALILDALAQEAAEHVSAA